MMNEISPEFYWGLLFFCVGLIKLLCVCHGSINQRKAASILGMSLWIVLLCFLAFGAPTTTGIPSYSTLVIANWINFTEIR
jgi:hypothetical protein